MRLHMEHLHVQGPTNLSSLDTPLHDSFDAYSLLQLYTTLLVMHRLIGQISEISLSATFLQHR